MARNVTAVYRTFDTAELVRRELEGIGLSSGSIHVIPDTPDATSRTATVGAAPAPGDVPPAGAEAMAATPAAGMGTADATGVTASGTYTGGGDSNRWLDAIDDLYLPDDDARTYKHCVQNGDYIVSAEVDDDQVDRAVAIMRRPEEEAHNLDTRGDSFRDQAAFPRREAAGDAGQYAARDPAHVDPYTRAYSRGERLAERRRD